MITPHGVETRDNTEMVTTDEPTILRFNDGVIGLPAVTQFVLTQVSPDAPPDALFQLLRSVDGSISIVVTQPWALFPDYAPELPDSELAELDITDAAQMTLFNPVTLDGEHGCVYVNLMGPFVVNTNTLQARQIVLTDTEWPLRARVDL
jgi:flagellar assembly factor FliW